MKCCFIVSAYDQPLQLAGLLYSLAVQTEKDFEVIVTDNHPDRINEPTCNMFIYWDSILPELFRRKLKLSYMHTNVGNCYEAANLAAGQTTADYLCFPSCDGYYVPGFLDHMLIAAHCDDPSNDLIYCDCIYDPRGHVETYERLTAMPKTGFIDKGGFLVKRSKFTRFPWEASIKFADGLLVEDLVRRCGATTAKAPGVLWVHN